MRAVIVNEEFERSKAGIVGRMGEGYCVVEQFLSQLLGERGWSDFDQLLVPPLQGAFSIIQMDDRVVLVGEYLD